MADYSCRQFNPPGDITALADAVEAAYHRDWPRTVSQAMTPEEKKAMSGLLNKAAKDPVGFFFKVAGELGLMRGEGQRN